MAGNAKSASVPGIHATNPDERALDNVAGFARNEPTAKMDATSGWSIRYRRDDGRTSPDPTRRSRVVGTRRCAGNKLRHTACAYYPARVPYRGVRRGERISCSIQGAWIFRHPFFVKPRGSASDLEQFPGRCPGLICRAPLGQGGFSDTHFSSALFVPTSNRNHNRNRNRNRILNF